MGITTKRAGVKAAETAINEYYSQANDYATQQYEIKASIRELQKRLATQFTNLSMALIPSVDANVVQTTSEELGALALPIVLQELSQEHDNNQHRLKMNQKEQVQCRKRLVDLNTKLVSFKEDVVGASDDAFRIKVLVHLLEEMNEDEQKHLKRVLAISKDETYKKRELLLHEQIGDWTVKLREDEATLGVLLSRFNEYHSNRDFVKVYKAREASELHGLIKLSFVLIVPWLMHLVLKSNNKRRVQRVLGAYDSSSLEPLFRNYEEAKGHVDTMQEEVDELQTKKNRLESLIREYKSRQQSVIESYQQRLGRAIEADRQISQRLQQEASDLNLAIQSFEKNTLDRLRYEVVKHLEACEAFADIRGQVRKTAKIAVTSVLAIKEQIKYLHNMIEFLSQEIRDRQARVASIDNVRRKWRKPSRRTRLRSDKTNWLVNLPASKRAGTNKRLGWINTMHHNVYRYDRYDEYDALLGTCTSLLLYDVITRSSIERMPYEGFSTQVIPDIAAYRDEHGALNYSEIDSGVGDFQAQEPGTHDGSVAAAAVTMAAMAAMVEESLGQETLEEDFLVEEPEFDDAEGFGDMS